MLKNTDKRLDDFAGEVLRKIKSRKTQQEQVKYLKDLFFRMPIMHSLNFPPELTVREIQVIYHAAFGATINETAKKTDLKPSTVVTHRKESIRKMKCRNITEAVYKCFCQGLLSSENVSSN